MNLYKENETNECEFIKDILPKMLEIDKTKRIDINEVNNYYIKYK